MIAQISSLIISFHLTFLQDFTKNQIYREVESCGRGWVVHVYEWCITKHITIFVLAKSKFLCEQLGLPLPPRIKEEKKKKESYYQKLMIIWLLLLEVIVNRI